MKGVRQGNKDLREREVSQDSQDLQVLMGHQVQLEKEGHKVLRVLVDYLVLLENKVKEEKLDSLAKQVLVGPLDSQD